MATRSRLRVNGRVALVVTAGGAPAIATSYAVSSFNGSSGYAGQSDLLSLIPIPIGSQWPSGFAATAVENAILGSFSPSATVSAPSGSGSALTLTWTPNSGVTGTAIFSFTNTSGITDPASFSYVVNAGGGAPPFLPPVTPTNTANRYDMVANLSAAAVGSPVTIQFLPNALWPSGSITPISSNGTFSPATVTVAQGTTTAPTTTYTPTAVGEHTVTASNSMGLYNPYGSPLNVFASSSGTAQTLAATLVRSDWGPFQRDTFTGRPVGFSSHAAGKGWGEVWINVTAIGGATGGLYVRLYDAKSAGATSSPGTGTALHSGPVQVTGTVSATGTFRMMLPAGTANNYMDVATDAAMTNVIRIANRFRVGDVLATLQRSFETGIARSYADGTVSPLSYINIPTWISYDSRYGNTDSGWFFHDPAVGADPYPYHYGEIASSGTQEFGRLWEARRGVGLSITGVSGSGGGINSLIWDGGLLCQSFRDTVTAACGSKFRHLWFGTGGADGMTETWADDTTRYSNATAAVPAAFPACAVISWCTNHSGTHSGSSGSALLGYARLQGFITEQLCPTKPNLVSRENCVWNDYVSGHASMAARIQYARTGFRQTLSAERAAFGGFDTAGVTGPTLAATGTLAGRVISIPYALNGFSALTVYGITFNNPTYAVGGATGAELAALFAVYATGGYAGNGLAISTSSAAINTSAMTIDITLAGTTGVIYSDASTGALPSGFSVHYGADFGVSNSAIKAVFEGGYHRSAFLADSTTDSTLGIPFGWTVRSKLDIAVT